MGSALAMDKWRAKLVWLAAGIPTPRFALLKAGTDWDKLVATLGMPLIVKPGREGSTIGLTKVTRAADLPAAYALAAKYDELVIAEEFVAGQELTASILTDPNAQTDMALPLVRIEAPQGNYDYQNKYFTDDTRLPLPFGRAARR